jgi:hypothetical protein
MAGTFSDFLENELLDHVFAAASYSPPATHYIGLWTSALSDSSDSLSAGEVSGGSYARVAVTANATNWPAAAAGAIANGVQFNFPTATGSWGTVTYGGIFDVASGAGNMLAWFDLTASKTIGSGDDSNFAVGDIDITLN